MKTKTTKPEKHPFHLHLEYFSRHPYVSLGVIALLMVAVVKSDHRILTTMRDAYNHGFGIVGQYMREEPTRSLVPLEMARQATISGK